MSTIKMLEHPDILVSYADPNAGHHGGVYVAASWVFHGTSEEVRAYRSLADGTLVARRAFHSGSHSLRKAEIEALGFKEEKLPGKRRFVKPVSRRAKRIVHPPVRSQRKKKLLTVIAVPPTPVGIPLDWPEQLGLDAA